MCGENCFKILILNNLCDKFYHSFYVLYVGAITSLLRSFHLILYYTAMLEIYKTASGVQTVFCLCASQLCEYGPWAIDMLIDSETDQSVCLQASLKQWAGCRRSTGTERRTKTK